MWFSYQSSLNKESLDASIQYRSSWSFPFGVTGVTFSELFAHLSFHAGSDVSYHCTYWSPFAFLDFYFARNFFNLVSNYAIMICYAVLTARVLKLRKSSFACCGWHLPFPRLGYATFFVFYLLSFVCYAISFIRRIFAPFSKFHSLPICRISFLLNTF